MLPQIAHHRGDGVQDFASIQVFQGMLFAKSKVFIRCSHWVSPSKAPVAQGVESPRTGCRRLFSYAASLTDLTPSEPSSPGPGENLDWTPPPGIRMGYEDRLYRLDRV